MKTKTIRKQRMNGFEIAFTVVMLAVIAYCVIINIWK